MEQDKLQVLLLHKHPLYLKPCCKMINEEWPRSEAARMMSLKASCDKLPTSLILVKDQTLLGHCKLSAIPGIPQSCFIETVVISKSMRGKKLGSYLMKEVESYCKTVLGLKMLHLSTKGQENFYAKLGYELCSPVSIYGMPLTYNKPNLASVKVQNPVPVITNKGALPPPPPPMPKIVSSATNNTLKSSKTFMFKYL